jgi:hypothetical protein
MSNRLRPHRRTRLGLEPLDAREVPAALVDLTTRGAEGAANGALFRQSDAHPTGSGVIHSFLRVQATAVEQGYNTDARPLQLNENKSPTFTRSLRVADVPTVWVDGVAYREFLLDINQKSSAPLLSLDELRLYVGGAPNLTGYDAGAKTLAGLSPVYDMDGGGDVTVKMDYRLNPGSGGGDVTVLVPDAALGAGGYVYLYSKFGGSWGGNAGFEEWAVRAGGSAAPPTTTPPPAGPASLSGAVYLDADGRHTIDGGDQPLGGIVINLINSAGTVVGTTTSAPDGTYSFTNMAPDTYRLQMIVPGLNYGTMYPEVGLSAGVADGEVDPTWSATNKIQLNAGDAGTGYNFGLYEQGM